MTVVVSLRGEVVIGAEELRVEGTRVKEGLGEEVVHGDAEPSLTKIY